MRIRDAVPADLCSGLQETLNELSPAKMAREQMAAQLWVRARNGQRTFVAVLGDPERVVGTISVYLEPKLTRACRPAAHIEDVAVHADFQRQGIGRALVEHAVAFARVMGCYKVVLDCAPSRAGFYQQVGFMEDGLSMRLNL